MVPHPAIAQDAIAILRSDHRELSRQLQDVVAQRNAAKRKSLWAELHANLQMHLEIEAEVFYPAFLNATENSLGHFLASHGHESLLAHIRDVSDAASSTLKFKSLVRSLGREFMYHVSDMEGEHGIFEEARKSGMDHDKIGRLFVARKHVFEIRRGLGVIRSQVLVPGS